MFSKNIIFFVLKEQNIMFFVLKNKKHKKQKAVFNYQTCFLYFLLKKWLFGKK